MPLQAVGERGAARDRVPHLGDDLGQFLVLHLGSQDLQTLDHGQTGPDHGGELPGEAGYLYPLDTGAELDLNLRRLLRNRLDQNPVLTQHAFEVGPGVGLHRSLNRGSRQGLALVFKYRHQ